MRTIWKGAISFGLIHIPIRVYSASRSRELSFKLLHSKDLSEIRYIRVCKEDGREVPWEEVVKGYEDPSGAHVILTEKDFESADPKKTKTIEILDFVEEKEIDPIYYDTPYYLEPEKNASLPFSLLLEALRKSKKVAIGHFVFRRHQHLGAIRVHRNLLVLQQLRYESEIIEPKELEIGKENVTKRELEVALKLIEELTQPFKAKNYSDTYTDALKELIRKKAKGQKIPTKKSAEIKSPKVQDILSLLESSLKKKRRKAA